MTAPDPDMAAMQAEAAKIQAQIDKLTTGKATTTLTAMKAAKRWLVWREEPSPEGKKPRKVPYYADGGMRGEGIALDSPDDVARFATFDAAVAACEAGRFTGLGFALGSDGTGKAWQGIDLDKLSEHIENWDLPDLLPGYVEKSPSGDGLHAIGYGTQFKPLKKDKLGVEAYASGRFFTFTGKVVRDPVTLDGVETFVESALRPRFDSKVSNDPRESVLTSSSATVFEFASLLDRLDPRKLDYDGDDGWVGVLMAGHHEFAGTSDEQMVIGLLERWNSIDAERYREGEVAKKWKTFKKTDKSKTIAHIREMAGLPRENVLAMWANIPAPPAAVDTAPAASGWNFKPCDVRHMMSTPAPPIPWLFDHRWQAGRGYLLTGIGGSSKTRFMYMQAIASITGVCAWGWSVVKNGKAVLILTEDTEEEAHLTLESTINAMGLTEEQREMVAENITIFALAGENVKLLEMRGTVLHESETLHGLEKMIMELGDVVFIGLDPALGLTEGDENSQNHQRTLGRCADNLAVRTGAAVAVISHATKASNNADELNSHNSRGGGSITDAMRGEYSMRTMTAKEAKAAGITDIAERKRLVQLVATKGNHLPPEAFVPIWFRRVEGGALTVAEISMDNPTGTVSKSHRKVYDVLVSEYAKTNEPVKLSDLKERCIFESVIQCPTPEAITKSLTRAMKALCEAGMATNPSRGKYLPVWMGDEDED